MERINQFVATESFNLTVRFNTFHIKKGTILNVIVKDLYSGSVFIEGYGGVSQRSNIWSKLKRL